jgi:DNA-binding PadR family transcriptional regulator
MVFAVLLSGRRLCGLAIIETCLRRTGERLGPRQGNLYPLLKKLEREKLVRAYEVKPGPGRGGRPRVDYALTAKGRKAANEVAAIVADLFDFDVV